jgi:hypothetical protein
VERVCEPAVSRDLATRKAKGGLVPEGRHAGTRASGESSGVEVKKRTSSRRTRADWVVQMQEPGKGDDGWWKRDPEEKQRTRLSDAHLIATSQLSTATRRKTHVRQMQRRMAQRSVCREGRRWRIDTRKDRACCFDGRRMVLAHTSPDGSDGGSRRAREGRRKEGEEVRRYLRGRGRGRESDRGRYGRRRERRGSSPIEDSLPEGSERSQSFAQAERLTKGFDRVLEGHSCSTEVW